MAEITTRDQEVRLLIPGTTFPVGSGKKGKLHLLTSTFGSFLYGFPDDLWRNGFIRAPAVFSTGFK